MKIKEYKYELLVVASLDFSTDTFLDQLLDKNKDLKVINSISKPVNSDLVDAGKFKVDHNLYIFQIRALSKGITIPKIDDIYRHLLYSVSNFVNLQSIK